MKFFNRTDELNFFNNKWKEEKAQLLIIYGKRRVGKTELCLKFAKDKDHIYFLGEQIPDEMQLKRFSEQTGNYFDDKFVSERGFGNWLQAFEYIANKKQKFVLIIDEFPYLAETNKGLPSTIQKAWDLHLKKSPVFLVLSGSSISMMEKTALLYKAPLYGRRTGQYLVKPFQFNQLDEVFPEKSFNDKLLIYSIAGGTVSYLNIFLEQKDILKTLEKYILTKGEPLYEEVEFLLREELKEPRNYFAILQALSLGKTRLSDIMSETGFDKGIASRYLSILNDLQLSRKEIPVTEKIPEKSRKGIYKIDDNFFNFWFRFVFKNKSLLEEGKTSEVLHIIRNALPELLSINYERVAIEILKKELESGKGRPQFNQLGRWWDKDQEIDIVALNFQSNEIMFGEVKYTNKLVGVGLYLELKDKASKVTWGRENRKEYFCLFSKSGFTKEMTEVAKKENVYLFLENKIC